MSQIKYYELYSSLGMIKQNLQFCPWSIDIQLDQVPIYMANLYRKASMKYVSQYRLQCLHYESDDPYLIKDIIEKRIQQIIINQDDDEKEYIINCTNNIQQEMLVSTDHIQTEQYLCDKNPLFKLGIGKYIKIHLKKQIQQSDSDLSRCLMVGLTTEQPQFEQDKQIWKSNAKCVKMHLLFYGSIRPFQIEEFNGEVINSINQMFQGQWIKQIQINKSTDSVQIFFQNMPYHMLDLLLCCVFDDLYSISYQVKVNQEPQPNIVLLVQQDILNGNIQEFNEKIEKILKKAKEKIQKEINILVEIINNQVKSNLS